jgi:hypothetical protein
MHTTDLGQASTGIAFGSNASRIAAPITEHYSSDLL